MKQKCKKTPEALEIEKYEKLLFDRGFVQFKDANMFQPGRLWWWYTLFLFSSWLSALKKFLHGQNIGIFNFYKAMIK